MKIILCTFLLCITAVSVFGKPQELKGILGQSVTFPAAVKEGGSLIHSGVTLGDVTSGKFTLTRNGEYSGRLQWDSSTGLFSLSGLKMEDIGEYKVQNTDQNIDTFFQLNVHMSVFGQSVELNGIEGQSVKFPAAVKKDGGLRYGGDPLGEVTSGNFTAIPNKKYSGRLQWDSSTGLFSLSRLREQDSGEYKVQNTDKNMTVFQLKVYINVSKPHVSITHNEYRCTLLCAAVRGTEVTLTLYREGEKKPYVTSPVRSHPHLDMTVPVESGTYTCEARNSVRRETSDPLTVGAHCTAPTSSNTATVVSSVIAAVLFVTLIAVLIYFLRCRNRSKHSTKEVEELFDFRHPPVYDEKVHGPMDPPAYDKEKQSSSQDD